jgi:exopolysaccharide biosynthesis polyprenyl glycosylphosphotransferase
MKARKGSLLTATSRAATTHLDQELPNSSEFLHDGATSDMALVVATGTATAASLGAAEPTRTAPTLVTDPAETWTRERFSSWSARYVNRLGLADALIGGLSVLVPALFSFRLREGGLSEYLILLILIGATAWPLAIFAMRGYTPSTIGVGTDEPRAVLRAGAAVVIVGAFPAGWFHNDTLLTLVVVAVPFAVVLSLTTRLISRKALHRMQRTGRRMRHVVVVGSAAAAKSLRQRLDKETHCGMKVIGACLPDAEAARIDDLGMPVLGGLGDVVQVVRLMEADAVAVAGDDATRHDYLRRLAWSLEGSGVELLVDPGLVEVAGPRMHIRPIMGVPLLHVEQPHFTGWRRIVKRGFDVVVTALGLVLISPLMLAIAAAVKLQDGGPVLFKQTRVGRAGNPFSMYKFRSMVIDAEAQKAALMVANEGKGGLFKLSNDPRITRLGRFLRDYSLDELPQLFNVLNGTMSLVGPRPHLAHELAEMPSESARRSLVTPGLTGLWQVSGRSSLAGDDAVRLDLRYVENWSLTLDMLILWKTGSAVLRRSGAM